MSWILWSCLRSAVKSHAGEIGIWNERINLSSVPFEIFQRHNLKSFECRFDLFCPPAGQIYLITLGHYLLISSLQGFGMPLAGYLIHWIGPRPAIATGCLIFSCGTALTYFTLNTVSSSSFTRSFLIIFSHLLPQLFLIFSCVTTQLMHISLWIWRGALALERLYNLYNCYQRKASAYGFITNHQKSRRYCS